MNKLTYLLLCLVLGIGLATAQTRKVTGTVISAEDSEPIIGASVIVKGTTTGTVTDFDGVFSLDVPSSAKTLVISYVGMIAREVPVQDVLRVVLQSGTQNLEEVVVTAIGMKKQEKALGYAASTVKSEDLNAAKSGSVMSGLTGKVAGLNITSGGATGSSQKVIVRGISSFSANQPLYVVDGVPYFDGGIADPVPVQKALEDGYDRVILILSRLRDEVRKQQKDLAPARILERSHPAAAEKLRMRYKTYNDELELAKHYEAEGKVLILAPEDLYGLNTLKKNFEGLEMMYRKGYAAAEAIPAFLQA